MFTLQFYLKSLLTILEYDLSIGGRSLYSWVFEDLSIMLLSLVLFIIALLAGIRIVMTLIRKSFPKVEKISNDPISFPYISIHIPFCNEPPEMVIRTIKSCLAQKYPSFEIVVLSNNTKSKKLWKPVKDFCKKHPDSIYFEHHKELEGYKGGALDVCRRLTMTTSEYLFTVDADYELEPFALRKAVRHLRYTKAHILQFPQFYANNLNTDNGALREELYSYFELFSKIGNITGTALPTGTLSLIRLDCLDSVDGWACRSITEDAELGVKLRDAGHRTYFVPEVLGSGMLPNTIADLLKQRSRWIFGNFQTLRSSPASGIGLNLSQLTVFLQLTAWLNLLAIPLVFLLWEVFSLGFLGGVPTIPLYLAIACIAVSLFGQFILMGISTGFSRKIWIGVFLTRLALLPTGAFQWIPALFGFVRPFECTNKFNKQTSLREFPILLPSLFLLLSIVTLLRGFSIGFLLLTLFLLFAIASCKLYRQFRTPRKVFKTQLSKI